MPVLYNVIVDGVIANDNLLKYREAHDLADDYSGDGWNDVEIKMVGIYLDD